MFGEALIIFACVNNSGCSEASDQYFREHPEIRKNIDREARYIKNYIGPKLVDTVGPVLFVGVGGTGVVHLHRNVSLQMSKQGGSLILSWSY